MSFTSPNIATQQAFRRQKRALFQRLRHNFVDKCIALLSGVVLFVFVQTEHSPNPPFPRQLQAEIVYDHKADDLDPDALVHQIAVTVTGPRALVENLHATDVRATVDLSDKNNDIDHAQVVLINYAFPRLPADVAAQLHIEGPPSLKLTLHTIKTKEFKIRVPDYSAPAGYHFGTPILKPSSVACSGRKDRIDRIDRVVVSLYSLATLTTNTKNVIQGDVDVVPLDHEGNIVQTVSVDNKTVHLQLPLIENELERNVTVSVPILPPSPSWTIEKVTVEPQLVKIKGMKRQLDQIYTISTQPFNLHDVTGTITRLVPLVPMTDVQVFDLQNNPVRNVTVTVTLQKLSPPSNVVPTDPPNGPANVPGVQTGKNGDQ
jgi:YbbR domain-containing protein